MTGMMIQLDAVPVSRFEANRQSYAKQSTFERATGIGDEAWFYDQGAGTSVHIFGVYARTAQHVFVLSVDVEKGETAASLRPVVVAAGQAAAAKLR
jgi:predicted cupin superfamily sugar epimerase